MAIISRRILKPILGKSKTALERSTKYKDIMVSNGVKARLGMFVGGELNGAIQLTAAYTDMTSATKSFASLSKNKEITELMSKRDDDPSGHLIGPEVYRSVYGQPSPEHNILLIREYEVDRKYVPQSVELLAEVEAIGKDEDTKILGLYPIIADKMDTLFVIYYYSSFESMGDIIDRVGMSEAFQNVVNKANEIGKLKASNVVRMI
ncbi:hypothetical protein N8310_07360 [Pseudomonadota bacterium]|nr:hypothetical protein [Alphaproteobacteria bacterium]MDC0457461.1 hypothetical protein [Alphaproteobacteria bacterium]MDC1357387.1 hypothetical protein [Pseudomonadota bacterium]